MIHTFNVSHKGSCFLHIFLLMENKPTLVIIYRHAWPLVMAGRTLHHMLQNRLVGLIHPFSRWVSSFCPLYAAWFLGLERLYVSDWWKSHFCLWKSVFLSFGVWILLSSVFAGEVQRRGFVRAVGGQLLQRLHRRRHVRDLHAEPRGQPPAVAEGGGVCVCCGQPQRDCDHRLAKVRFLLPPQTVDESEAEFWPRPRQVRPPVRALRADARGSAVSGVLSPDSHPRSLRPWGRQQSEGAAGRFLGGGGGHGEVSGCSPTSVSAWRFGWSLPCMTFRTAADDSRFPGRRLAESIVEISFLLNSEELRFFENNK